MRERNFGSRFINLLSVVYMVAAVWLLFTVCGYCYPLLGNEVRQVIAGWKDGPVQEAFRIFSDSLEAGLPVRDTVRASAEVLFGELV